MMRLRNRAVPWIAYSSSRRLQARRIRSDRSRGGYENDIAAIFLMDEPYHNAAGDRVPADRMRTWLAQMAAQVRADFPDIPVGVILATPTLASSPSDSSYIAMFDWIGFDCYGPWRSCAGRPMSRVVDIGTSSMPLVRERILQLSRTFSITPP